MTTTAKQIADQLKRFSARPWEKHGKSRVYVSYPRWENGQAGGGEMGYIDVQRRVYVGPATGEMLDQIRSAIPA